MATKQEFDKNQDIAMLVITAIEGLYPNYLMETGEHITELNKAARHLMRALSGVSPNTARQHITKAQRRKRHPDYQDSDNWGGANRGQGRKRIGEIND